MATENDADSTHWESLPDVPNTTDDFRGYAMASVRDTVYISGGKSNNIVKKSVLSYDLSTGKWALLPDMVFHRWGHQLGVIDGGQYLFAIGGWGYRTKAEDGSPSSRRKTRTSFNRSDLGPKIQIEKLNSCEIYDLSKRTWKEAGTLLDHRKDFAISVDSTSGKVYVFGGRGARGVLSSAEVYDPHTNGWSALTPMPRPSKSCYTLHIGNLIHVFESGRNTTMAYNTVSDEWYDSLPDGPYIPKCPNRGNACSSATSCSEGSVVIYEYIMAETDGQWASRWMIAHIAKNKRSKSWTVIPPADAFMYYRTAIADGKVVFAVNNSLLAFPFVDDSMDASQHCYRKLESLESILSSTSEEGAHVIEDDSSWTPQTVIFSKTPDFRGYAVASARNKIYLSGGLSGASTVHRSFVSYDVKKKKWKQLPSMTHHRLGHRMAVSRDGRYIYVLGGGDGKTTRSLGIDIYDVKNRSWTVGPAMNSYRVFFGVTVYLGNILVFGGVGSSNGTPLDLVEFFDPETNSWNYSKPMPEARGVCNVTTLGHIIYVFGTSSERVLSYDIISGEWLDNVPHGVFPAIPKGGCVCASSSYSKGELLIYKYPFREESSQKQKRTAHVYNAPMKAWSSVDLLDDFACYSAIVTSEKIVVVTAQNQFMSHSIPKRRSSSS